MDTVSSIGAFFAIILLFVLHHKPNKSLSDKILFAWFVLFALNLSIPFFIQRQILFNDTIWGVLLGSFFVLHFPMLFIYTRSLTQKDYRFTTKCWLNFLWVVVYLISLIPYFKLSVEQRRQLFLNEEPDYIILLPLLVYMFLLVFYITRTVLLLHKHQRNVKQTFSYQENVNLDWLKRLVFGFIGILLLSVIVTGLMSANQIGVKIMDYAVFVGFIILLFCIGYWGYKQERIFSKNDLFETEIPEKGQGKAKKPVVANEQVGEKISDTDNENINQLLTLMETKKPYLDPELNIGTLANDLKIHSYVLSKNINSILHLNFFEFVNGYRVDEFKRLCDDSKNKNFSILALALDAGFNSKASFNRIFKNNTGQTPSEFRKLRETQLV